MSTSYQLEELNFETRMGGAGSETHQRQIPLIDLGDFEARREDIVEQIWQAATQVGFFQLVNHGIATEDITKAFALSERFFAQSDVLKSQYALKPGLNAGWEYKAQVRPSTGTADQKESYQITLPHMQNLWPSQSEVADFQSSLMSFEHQAWQLGMAILSCFADRLGFARDFFRQAHDRMSTEYQSTLRLLHYLPLPKERPLDPSLWRAGAHTDFDCLTLVFQREGQGGLQVCPGKEAMGKTSQEWTSVATQDGVITCNIGDMLVRWSDDALLSTLHRVRMPRPDEAGESRYSMAFFCQANKDQVIQGPSKKYPPITAGDYLLQRINANFSQ